ncbi:glutaredoxin family protein [Psychrobium sp. 1_MG-2023]|uniref:glutaredoxin family protein n=1 Tax=Psychrobium sp. 1_MG-2023 TaxID=3062624 RepID=UPI000C348946|nr:glutaredoxin family protein [Psychrobium sp. 1_MG-2023]MDP2561710.1 glutaredoxin family protein [Psychrobium sp. 1_MG-2023]PKF57111.1 NrdH-redoxin [Alteromonadales bacterium alter-6D02]
MRITLYTSNNCPHCKTAKAYLTEHKIPFRLCNIQSPAGSKEFRKLGLRSVPVLKMGEKVIQGFSIKTFNQHYRR